MSVHITKYTKPSGCGQCFASDRALGVPTGGRPSDKEPVPHTSIEFDDKLADHFKSINAPQAPVFVLRDIDTAEIVDFWTGFRPDKIKDWKDEATEAPEGDKRFTQLPESYPKVAEVAVAS